MSSLNIFFLFFFDRWYLAPGERWRPMLEKTIGSSRAGQYLSDRAKRALGDRKKWTSRSTFKVEALTSRLYRCYCPAPNLRWAF
jgi:hypothetical protein